jgi:NAD(P)H-nitrite reductase large subunit
VEIHCTYDRVHLSEYFAGKTAEDFDDGTNEWRMHNGISLILSDQWTLTVVKNGSFRIMES